jgi:predicted nucleic acid-binding protein
VSTPIEFVFIDTNVLVYAYQEDAGAKRELAASTLNELWDNGKGALSTQVLQEFYWVATHKLKPPMAHPEARDLIAQYSEWCTTNSDLQLLVSASVLAENHSFSWWDALIIEAALRSGATTLLSEDMQDGRRIGRLTIENPFRGVD